MKNKFVVDWALLPSSILSAFSGIKLHMLGHGMEPAVFGERSI